jgi:hypothetical protein
MPDRDTRALDWRRLLPAAGRTTIRLRQLLLGGALAGVGLLAVPKAQGAETRDTLMVSTPPSTISERGKRAARLVLTLPGVARNLLTQHRSHSSHSSHRSHSSHYSGSGGSSSGAVLPVAPSTPAATAARPLSSELEPNTVVGIVEKIDRIKRTFSLKTAAGSRDFSFRDDTQFEIVAGVAVRLDEYAEAHPTSFPIAEKERVRITWRVGATALSQVATRVSPAKP